MFGAPNSRRSVPGRTHPGGEIEDEEKFLASLGNNSIVVRNDGADACCEYARGEMFISLT